MTDLEALAGRVEQATGADRELDAEIAVAALGFFECAPRWEGGPIGYGYIDKDGARVEPGHGGEQLVRQFTASIDAAMSLVPEECLAMVKHLWDGPKRCGYAFVSQYQTDAEESDGKMWVTDFTGCAETPALALTAAALRARSQAQEADRG